MASQGIVHIATNTFSAVTSSIFDNCFSSTYKNYYAVAKVTTTGSARVRGRLRAAGTDDSGSNYGIQYLYAASGSLGGIRGTGDTVFNGTFMDGGTKPNFGEFWLHRPFEATRTTAWSESPSDLPQTIQWTFVHKLSTSYDGISFLITNAGESMTGSISIFGLVTA